MATTKQRSRRDAGPRAAKRGMAASSTTASHAAAPRTSAVDASATRSTPARGARAADEAERVFAELERFVARIASLGDDGPLFVDVRRRLPAAGAAALTKFEADWKRLVPADIAAFWARGFANFAIEDRGGEVYAMARFDAPSTPTMRAARKIFHDEAKDRKSVV
jgi:hypothetical protein